MIRPKFNAKPENDAFQKEFPFSQTDFLRFPVKFCGVYPKEYFTFPRFQQP